MSTEKREVSTKGEAVLCPGMSGQFYPGRPRLPSGGGGVGRTKQENNTEYGMDHLNPDRTSENMSCATFEGSEYLDQPRH